jgi:putative FmdB family regulatory protein
MPIFEYRCKSCGKSFEAIVSGSSLPACPDCASADLEKQFSVFAVGSGGPSPSSLPPGCASCGDPRGPGACGMN